MTIIQFKNARLMPVVKANSNLDNRDAVEELKDAVMAHADSGAIGVSLDLASTRHINGYGVCLLLLCYKRFAQRGLRFEVKGSMSEEILMKFNALKLNWLIEGGTDVQDNTRR